MRPPWLPACKAAIWAITGPTPFGVEPLPADSPLRAAPRTLFTPHVAWATGGALKRLMEITARNLETFLAGAGGEHRQPVNAKNPRLPEKRADGATGSSFSGPSGPA